MRESAHFPTVSSAFSRLIFAPARRVARESNHLRTPSPTHNTTTPKHTATLPCILYRTTSVRLFGCWVGIDCLIGCLIIEQYADSNLDPFVERRHCLARRRNMDSDEVDEVSRILDEPGR